MIGMARNAQAYQQAQQLNPLVLRQQQATTDVAEQTAAPKISTAKSEAATSLTGSQSAAMKFAQDQAKQISHGYIGAINDPVILEATNNPTGVDKQKLVNFVQTWADNQATAAGIPKERTAELAAPYLKLAQENPAGLRNYMIERHIKGLNDAAQVASYQPTTEVDTSGRTVTKTPNIGQAPTVTVGQAGGFQTNAPANINAGAEVAPGMRVPYPVRRADTPYRPEPTEIANQNSGVEYRNRIVNAQGTLSENRRNVEEVIKQANLIGANLTEMEKGGGLIGKAGQKIRMAINSAEYEILAKDLARLALSNANAMGGAGNTVAGLDMQQVANGTIKMPPEKLIEIARRVQSGQTNLDLQARGAQQFVLKYGDNNMKDYQQSWNANADDKIFEGINIINNEPNPKKINEQLTKLFPTEAKKATFLKKYRNIKSLAATGLQAEPLTKEDF
jgi:hypothetical protein